MDDSAAPRGPVTDLLVRESECLDPDARKGGVSLKITTSGLFGAVVLPTVQFDRRLRIAVVCIDAVLLAVDDENDLPLKPAEVRDIEDGGVSEVFEIALDPALECGEKSDESTSVSDAWEGLKRCEQRHGVGLVLPDGVDDETHDSIDAMF